MSAVHAPEGANRAPLCVMLRSQDMEQKIFSGDAAQSHQSLPATVSFSDNGPVIRILELTLSRQAKRGFEAVSD